MFLKVVRDYFSIKHLIKKIFHKYAVRFAVAVGCQMYQQQHINAASIARTMLTWVSHWKKIWCFHSFSWAANLKKKELNMVDAIEFLRHSYKSQNYKEMRKSLNCNKFPNA